MSSVVIPAKYIEAIAGSKDPKKAILDMVGNLDEIEVFGDMVLVGIYIRPGQTKGGVWLPDQTKAEDIWQGKAGLVLKCGPDAFIDPDSGERYEQAVKPGEWCVYKVGDAWPVSVKGAACRMVRDVGIKMKIQNPEVIF